MTEEEKEIQRLWPDWIKDRTFFVGVDLGKQRDHSALVVLERRTRVYGPPRSTDWGRKQETLLGVRLAERIKLGTPYQDVVTRVGQLVRSGDLSGNCRVAVDATGVGMPVVEMMKRAHYTCPIDPVVLTGGQMAHLTNGLWHVPKHELMTRLTVSLEGGRLKMGPRVSGAEVLFRELQGMRVKRESMGKTRIEAANVVGAHDDLVALGLGCWAGCRDGRMTMTVAAGRG